MFLFQGSQARCAISSPSGRRHVTVTHCWFLALPQEFPSTQCSAELLYPLVCQGKWGTALLPLLHEQTAPHSRAGTGRCCCLPSLLGQGALDPKGMSRGLSRLEMPSGRMAPGRACCRVGSGCSDGPRAELNSSLAQLPFSAQHMDTKQDTYCIIRALKSTSRVLCSSCDTQCQQRLRALSCLELEYQSNSSYCL